jgi:hypothetical protein
MTDNLPKGLRLIQGIYWFNVLARTAVLTGKAAGLWKEREIYPAFMIVSILIESILLFGIYKRKSWLVPLALIYSYLNLAWGFYDVMVQRALDTKMLGQNLAGLLLALFCIYQIAIFSRPETKQYYKEKGTTLI